MIWANRLLSAILTLALVLFGVMATAPVHAHQGGSSHGVRELSLTHSIAHGHAHEGARFGLVDHHDDHAAEPASPTHESSPADTGGDPADGEHAAHVHGCPHFAPTETGGIGYIAIGLNLATGPPGYQHIATRAAAPPLRPPRTTL
jgi:hypothetical protein